MTQKKPADESKAFEKALEKKPETKPYVLRLFLTGSTPRSTRAIRNIKAICEEKLPGRYQLEVIDIYQHPELAGSEQILVAPTLVKKLPTPVRKLIGDLSDIERVLVGLDILPRTRSANAARR